MVAAGAVLRLRLHLSPNMHFVQSPSHGLSSGLYRSFDSIRGSFLFFSKVICIQPFCLSPTRSRFRTLSEKRWGGSGPGPGWPFHYGSHFRVGSIILATLLYVRGGY